MPEMLDTAGQDWRTVGARRLVVAGLVGAALFILALPAAAVCPGNEFVVNTTTAGQQYGAAIAMEANGNFVIVWQSQDQDGDGVGIFAQRFDATCTPLGPQFQVNTVVTAHQISPAVAMDAVGNFVVVWETWPEFYPCNCGIFAQRYDADGTPLGTEFQVSDGGTAAIAMDADGDFVVIWQGHDVDVYPYSRGIFAQRFDANGTPQGGPFRVNTFTTGTQETPAIAMDSDGDFVIVWASEAQDGDGYGVFGQRYAANGTARGSEFQVNTFTAGDQRWYPTVAMDADGDFVVAWSSELQDGDSMGVFAQQFDANGSRQGSEFQVNTSTAGSQWVGAVAIEPGGDFIVVWDTAVNGVFAQRFRADGASEGNEFQGDLSPWSGFGQLFDSSIAVDAEGNFVALWTGLWNEPLRIDAFGRGFASNSSEAEFRGRVRNVNKEAVDGARVTAFQGGNPVGSRLADQLGRYSFPVSAGTFDLVASKTGYLDTTKTGMTIVTGETRADIDFKLFRPSTFEGTVREKGTGLPLEGALVEAIKDGVVVASATTWSTGAYALVVKRGKYTLRVALAGYSVRKKRDQRIGDGATKTGVNFALAPLP